MKKIVLGILIVLALAAIGGYIIFRKDITVLLTGSYSEAIPGEYAFFFNDGVTSDQFYSKLGQLDNYQFGSIFADVVVNDSPDAQKVIESLSMSYDSNQFDLGTKLSNNGYYGLFINGNHKSSNAEIKQNITKLKDSDVVKEIILTFGSIKITSGNAEATAKAFQDSGLFKTFEQNVETITRGFP